MSASEWAPVFKSELRSKTESVRGEEGPVYYCYASQFEIWEALFSLKFDSHNLLFFFFLLPDATIFDPYILYQFITDLYPLSN